MTPWCSSAISVTADIVDGDWVDDIKLWPQLQRTCTAIKASSLQTKDSWESALKCPEHLQLQAIQKAHDVAVGLDLPSPIMGEAISSSRVPLDVSSSGFNKVLVIYIMSGK
ncbi:uncharacterized protein LOC142586394 [Dermacentor variabilis]|uniref:uncharacterized protein LOC142586394 n=1 Tax=Dermacentor variabilis TaxID=34621 RepID=UPI003F5C594E